MIFYSLPRYQCWTSIFTIGISYTRDNEQTIFCKRRNITKKGIQTRFREVFSLHNGVLEGGTTIQISVYLIR